MEKIYHTTYESIIGTIHILASTSYIENIILFNDVWEDYPKQHIHNGTHPLGEEAKRQIGEYFSHKRYTFELPYKLDGTAFQNKVWHALTDIPYGETRSYQQIAQTIGNEKAVRAIGQANRCNPLPILIPCHRVIGKNGKLMGYAGPHSEMKEKLLALEKVMIERGV